jgi:endonuclease G
MDLMNRLQNANAAMRRRDKPLDDELQELSEGQGPSLESAGGDIQVETIVFRTGRPVLAIKNDEAQLTFDDADSHVWQSRLTEARQRLVQATQAVGRIEVEGHSLDWVGTGWLVGDDTIVTNRHVAAEFGRHDGTTFVFRQGLTGGPMRASIDLLRELDREDSLTFELREIIHIEEEDGPDLAFLRVEPISGGSPPTPITLAASVRPDDFVAVIGYPARDSRIPDLDLMDRIFGNVYDRKRLAPGQVMDPTPGTLTHDCSTLGGNSGSVVLSLETGQAVGLHFAGRFLKANFAVPSSVVGDRLDDVLSRPSLRRAAPGVSEDARAAEVHTPREARTSVTQTFLVPISVTVEIGDPSRAPAATGDTASRHVDIAVGAPAGPEGEVFGEGVPEDYVDREGYVESFLGEGLVVSLPEVTGDPEDVLSFEFQGREQQVLKYEHFSVLMSRSRRMCRYSAVNIDGNLEPSRGLPRSGWRTDPRIPAGAQIKDECYGNPPRFSRGHMTRREDPIWGSPDAAARGNSDSMHVTNAVPQMQPFNAGVWLELEDYALQHARRDDMKISVFTGPFLEEGDPMRFGVKVPVEFWKVIAFIHEDTGQLCSTGYRMSQRDFLSESEFVFGAHKTAQVTISSIESRTGLSFRPLGEHDPFVETEGVASELTDVTQVQFLPPG